MSTIYAYAPTIRGNRIQIYPCVEKSIAANTDLFPFWLEVRFVHYNLLSHNITYWESQWLARYKIRMYIMRSLPLT